MMTKTMLRRFAALVLASLMLVCMGTPAIAGETIQTTENTLVFEDGKDTLEAVEYGDDGIADAKYFTDRTRETIDDTKLPSVTLTENLGLNQSGFDYMSSASGSYGAWKTPDRGRGQAFSWKTCSALTVSFAAWRVCSSASFGLALPGLTSGHSSFDLSARWKDLNTSTPPKTDKTIPVSARSSSRTVSL